MLTCQACGRPNSLRVQYCLRCRHLLDIASQQSVPVQQPAPPPAPLFPLMPLSALPNALPSPRPSIPGTLPPIRPHAHTPSNPLPPLPPELRRLGPPQLEGEIEGVDMIRDLEPMGIKHILPLATGIGASAASAMTSMTGALLGTGGSKGMPRINTRAGLHDDQLVHVLTINKQDRTQTQARVVGDLVGALMRQGDDVALWGQFQHGVLYVMYGYDYTLGAHIRVRNNYGRILRSGLGLFSVL